MNNIKKYLSDLSERDQILALSLAIAVVLVILVGGLVLPEYNRSEVLSKSYEQKVSDLKWMHQAKAIIAGSGATAGSDNRALASRVSLALRSNNIKNIDINSRSPGKTELRAKGVVFVDFHRALFELESRWQVEVKSLKITRLENKPGLVDVVASFAR
jgi:type II secretory pathway component PulM